MIYWGVDPGEKTGWAYFDNGEPKEFREFSIEDFYRFMWRQPPPEIIVMEDYIVRPRGSGGFDHSWGHIPTIQVIGAVKCYATVHDLPKTKKGERVVLQQSDILGPASARFKLPHPRNQSVPQRNAISAILHGRWWWYREGSSLVK